MQAEIKVALNFLLSFMYDKLPRRRVNLFGDELEKYLTIKLANTVTNLKQLNDVDANCLSVNFKSLNGDDIIDPCLIAAAKDTAIDIYEILDCLPNRFKLFIRPGFVFYAMFNLMNEFDEIKVLYDEKTSVTTTNEFNLSKLDNNTNKLTTSKSVTSKLNMNSLLDVKPFQPLNMTNDYSSLIQPQHLDNNVLLTQMNSLNLKDLSSTDKTPGNKQLFTTATFAQTKFGTTKKKNTLFGQNNQQQQQQQTQRPTKQQNPKMLSTEFSNYIKTTTELKNLLSTNRQLSNDNFNNSDSNITQTNQANLNEISNVLFKNFNDSQLDNATIAAKLEILFQQQQQQQQLQLVNPSPIISPASSSSSVSSNYDLFTNSTTDDLEDNLINSYFNPLLSSATFLTPPTPQQQHQSALPCSLLTFQNNFNDFKFESDN